MALTYRNRNTTGALGVGWSLGGMPVISRCPNIKVLGDDQNLGVTYDNTKDKLCLNGKRLKVVSGQYFQSNSKYRTDIDEYSLILFDGNYFTVVQRDGVEIQLDVRQWLSASSDIVLAWYPSAVADRFGNEIAYTYQNGKGIEYPVTNSSGYNFGAGIYPKDIIYGNKKIEFSYVDRAGSSFPRVRYIAGQAQSEPLLLDTITTFIGTEEVGTTQLLYDALLHTRMNILVGVQECRQDSASASGKLCKKETRFDWLYANSQSNDYIETGATYPRKVGGSAVYESVSLDWNGDNVVDLLTVSLDGSMRVLLGAINPAERKLLTIRNPTLAKHPTAITPVDLNSDGKDDLIYLEHEVVENSDPGSSYGSYKKMSSFWRVLISNGSTVPTTNVIEVDSLGDVYLTAEYLQGDMYSKLLHSHINAAGPFPVVADFTGDGKPELVLPARKGDTDEYFWRAYDVSEPGTELGFVQAFDLNVSFNDYFVAQALDHNGDGIPGIVFESPQNPDLFVSIAPQYWEGKGVGPQSTHLYKSQGTGSSGIDFPEELVQSTLYFDHNGDGLKDILARYIDPAETTGKGQFAVFINTGSQSSGPKFKNAGEVLGNVYEDFNVVKVADIDHDGRDDLILAVGDFPGEKSLKVGLSWPILSSKSNGDLKPIIAIRELLDSVDTLPLPPEVESSLETIANLTGPDSKGFYFWYSATRALQQLPWLQLADINGDGGIDILLPKDGTDGQSWQTYYNRMPAPLSIASIRDGLGNVVDVSYSPLSDSSVHTPSSGAKFPVQDVSGGLYVVDSVKRSNGVGGLNEDTYRYSGAKVHRTGFGFLGFDTVFATKQVGAETETTTETRYSQGTDQYALLGKPTTSVVSDSSGIPLSKQYNDWQEITPVPTVTHVPYLKEQISCRYETDGTLTSAAIESVLDIDSESGIPTHTEVISGYTANCSNVANVTLSSTVYKKVTEVDSTDIINNNSDENWFVGFVGKQKVTESVDHTSKDTKSNVTRFTQYFNNGKPTAKVGQETRFEGSANQEITTTRDFDSFGNLVAETVTPANAAPRSWSWSNFTDNQFPAETENPLNQRQTNIVYDQRFGNVALMVDIDGIAESSVFDGFGRLVSTTSKQGTVTEHRYLICDSDCSSANDAVYRVETVQRNNSVQVAPKTVTYLDQFEREILSETEKFKGGLVRVKTEYDAFGRLQRVTQPYSSNSPDYWKEYKAYDVLNRPTLVWLPKSVKYAEQPTIEFDYEARNSGGVTVTKTEKVVNETGSRLLTTQEETDSSGFLVKRTEGYQSPDAVSTEFRYDALGNIRWSRVAGDDKSIVLREYNDANQLISQTDPSSGQKTFANDALGNLLSLIDNGTTTAFTYDKLNRIKTRTDDVGGENFDTEWYYDESSRCVNGKKTGSLCFVEQHGLSIAYAYDNLGRLTDENWLIGKQVGEYQYFSYPIRYQYDNQSRVERLTYPNNEWVSYHYAEQTGDVERIDLNGSMRYQVVSADSLGRVQEVEYGNENHTTYEYDNANGLLLETTTFFDTETLQSFSYAWNSNGNLASRKDNLCTDTSICSSSDQFGYDNLNRLTQYTPTTTLQGL
ncbi:MAG: FG-GAP-like repeat-containing protein, partial [Pseudomonadales bacterium]|nr:FG-GAP-like repeat-containing protein [Pseudomonadales bacterium]